MSHSSKTSEDPQPYPTLLPDIIIEILLRLPVKSLLQCKSVCKLWCSTISDLHFVKSHLRFSTARIELDYPRKHTLKYDNIAGSCNGLLLMVMKNNTLLIWNPSTRRSNRLPYGSFKSLKTGNWKNIGDFPFGVAFYDFGKFSNGALHWAVSRDCGSFHSWKIVSLDLANETYEEISQPVYDEGDKALTLGALGDWLCVLCDYYGNRADVWVVKDSWTKLVSIPYLPCSDWKQFSVPLCITNDGKVLLRFGIHLYLYDSKTRSFSDIVNIDEHGDNKQGQIQGKLGFQMKF
ncbi:hypothetical protein L1887_01808 [Cichorium endivia]|nr:hypothetical protein L1887_01808 [Cichorium endivia]